MTKMPKFHLTQWPHVKVAFLFAMMRDSSMLVMRKEMMCSVHETPHTWLVPVGRKAEWHEGHFCHWQTMGLLGQKNLWAIPVAPALPSWNSKWLGTDAYQALHCNFKCVRANQTFHMHVSSEKEWALTGMCLNRYRELLNFWLVDTSKRNALTWYNNRYNKAQFKVLNYF